MHYLITGVDAPIFGSPDEVNAAHQDYMDTWADRLIARGPTLSSDGRTHTGSVHVVDLPDLAAARRFAHDEPYSTAGWYSTVTVSPIRSCFEGTMWDRPAPAIPGVSALITVEITEHGTTAAELARALGRQFGETGVGCVYAGVTYDEPSKPMGLIALLDHHPEDALQKVEPLLDRDRIGCRRLRTSRWRRGGRHAAE